MNIPVKDMLFASPDLTANYIGRSFLSAVHALLLFQVSLKTIQKTRCQEAELKIDLPSLPPYIHYIIVESRSVSPKRNETVWVLVEVSFLRKKDAAILQGTDIPVLIAHHFYRHTHS